MSGPIQLFSLFCSWLPILFLLVFSHFLFVFLLGVFTPCVCDCPLSSPVSRYLLSSWVFMPLSPSVSLSDCLRHLWVAFRHCFLLFDSSCLTQFVPLWSVFGLWFGTFAWNSFLLVLTLAWFWTNPSATCFCTFAFADCHLGTDPGLLINTASTHLSVSGLLCGSQFDSFNLSLLAHYHIWSHQVWKPPLLKALILKKSWPKILKYSSETLFSGKSSDKKSKEEWCFGEKSCTSL